MATFRVSNARLAGLTVAVPEQTASVQDFAGAAFRAVTAAKDGPSLYDVCDPILLNGAGGDAHLSKFYKTGLGNPPLRALLRRSGLPELRDDCRIGDAEAFQTARMLARREGMLLGGSTGSNVNVRFIEK